MRLLVLSDVHGNLEALEAVLADAALHHVDDAVCLGDVVGYSASPREVISRLRTLALRAVVRGNHDRVCAGFTSADTFSPAARTAIAWTRTQLTPEDLQWISSMPHGPVLLQPGILLAHGAPQDEDFYVQTTLDAGDVFNACNEVLCLHGHTHAQTVFRLTAGRIHDETPVGRACYVLPLAAESRWIVNPGSVGQPRDGDPRAGYAILDTGASVVELRRVAYDIAGAQKRIRAAALPYSLAERLTLGE